MSKKTFFFYRIKLYEKSQQELFTDQWTRKELLSKLIRSHPAKQGRNKSQWTIGNVEDIDKDMLYFRLGRISKKQIPDFDKTKEFFDLDIEYAPYSHCIINVEKQILLISFDSELSKTFESLGKSLERLLAKYLYEFRQYKTLIVNPLYDPNEFIDVIDNAYAVQQFWAIIGKTNLFDADEEFIKPLEKINDLLNGKKSKHIYTGDDLDRTKIKRISNSNVLSGEKCGALVVKEKGMKSEAVKLNSNPRKYQGRFDHTKDDKKKLAHVLNHIYNEIVRSL